MHYTIGVDVGGTFTDVVGVDEEGREVLAKAASTPQDQSEGVLDGLRNLAAAIGLTLSELLETTTRIVHGTTVATNALLERRGAKTGMLTTEGHRDVTAMREGLKPARYDLRLPQPPALVPRELRLPVRERLRPDGRVEIPLDAASLNAAIAKLREAQVESVAICFLHSWAAPQHEHAAAVAVRAALPDVFITCSADVLPQIKEFERFSTTAVNAYVGPIVSRYLTRLEARLREAGYGQPVFVILSHGGMAPIAEAARLAVGTALSGPAGGVAAAMALARRGLGDQLVTLDMGGTSSDIALIQDGAATLGRGREVGGERIALDSLDIITLGAGGGSIAHLGSGGTLEVGPQSAGARPGPACYGNGGTEATVTDANLALGYLDGTRFLGGARQLDVAAAERAVATLATKLNITPEATALGIYRLVNARMADGVRIATVRRGVDPRGATLLAFGGAAGLHASAVARDLGMSSIAVPLFAAGLSAWGMLQTELRHEIARSVVSATAMPDGAALAQLFDTLESDARAQLAQWFNGEVVTHRAADLRYGEQVFEITVNLDDVIPTQAGLRAAFHARHRALFTYDLPEEEVVLVTARAAASGLLPALPLRPAGAGTASIPLGTRRALLESGWAELPVHGFDNLMAGQVVTGPAIIESATTTVLLLPGDTACMDQGGWLMISV